ncbi:MAG: N-6 DNA methylase, partial [Mycolicibacterium sp.]
GELQTYSLLQAERDAIGEAFEVFIGPALRGPEGQFFTPRNVVRALVDMVDPKPGELIIDPACMRNFNVSRDPRTHHRPARQEAAATCFSASGGWA